MPFEGFTCAGYYTPEGEADRQRVNAWIRTSGRFDAVIDFDADDTRDPAQPRTALAGRRRQGDHLASVRPAGLAASWAKRSNSSCSRRPGHPGRLTAARALRADALQSSAIIPSSRIATRLRDPRRGMDGADHERGTRRARRATPCRCRRTRGARA
ncbi:MAG: hypothetical protein MZV63_15945 [Marinilabiliales bacterium]|nr:hypothetical protein [Marinilabiliales bacterium]